MIQLPRTFKPTHETAGLPGYPAIDVFGQPNETVIVKFSGKVRRISGKPCVEGGKPGGAYGQSLYIVSPNGDDRYLTHLNKLLVKVGDYVIAGTAVATLCDSAVSGKPGTTHCHYGMKKATNPPPPPPERLYDVRGPKGRLWVKHQPISVVAEKLPALVRKWGPMRVSDADQPE